MKMKFDEIGKLIYMIMPVDNTQHPSHDSKCISGMDN